MHQNHRDNPRSLLLTGGALLQRLQTEVRLLQEEAEEAGAFVNRRLSDTL